VRSSRKRCSLSRGAAFTYLQLLLAAHITKKDINIKIDNSPLGIALSSSSLDIDIANIASITSSSS
jgi:hypothetical protein